MSAFSWLVRELISLFLCLLAIICCPFAVFLLPVYLWRKFVALLATKLKPDFGKMMSPRGNLFAVELDEMFSKRSRCTIFVSHVIDGFIPLEGLREQVHKNVIQKKVSEGTDTLLNPELQQKLCSWMGYLFWRWDKTFKIENHVKMYDGPGKVVGVSDIDIAEIGKELASRPFTPGQSPWEFWLWNHAKLARDPEGKEKSIVLLRVHHSLADGYSVLKILLEDLAQGEILTEVAQAKRKTKRKGMATKLWTLAMGPLQMIRLSIQSWDFNEWHIPESRITGKLNSCVSDILPLEDIKEIKKMYNTTFDAVIHAAFTGGFRNFMIQQGVKVPKAVHCMTPLPFPNHPKKLRNHMTAFIAPLPVGISDPVERIREIDRVLRMLHASAIPLATFFMLPIIGCLPAWVIRILATNSITTCLMTNFPATLGRQYLLGKECDDVIFGGGLLVGNIGIGFNSLSYNGNIRLGAGIDEGVIKDPEAVKTLIQFVLMELDILKTSEIV